MIVQRKRDALSSCRTEISRFEVGILENLLSVVVTRWIYATKSKGVFPYTCGIWKLIEMPLNTANDL